MIKFKTLKIKNFLSFGNKTTEFNIGDDKTKLIVGKNEDIGEAGSSKNGAGKCHGIDTPILMYDGTVKMVQDIRVGEQLMGDDGTPRNVLSLARGREELFRVKQNIGMDYVVNRSHILSLKVGTNRPAYGLVEGEIVNIPVETYISYPSHIKKNVCGYIANLTEFDNGEECFEPWLLGLWLADGTTTKAEITYNRGDSELYDEVRRIANTHRWGKNISPSEDRENCFTESYSGGFLRFLKDLGVIGNKHIPTKYLHASYTARLELLAGFIDGDGFVEKGKHAIDMCLKDNALVDNLVFLSRSLGLRTNVRDKFCKCQNSEGEIYKRITITGDLEKIPVRLTRRKVNPKSPKAKPRHFGVTGISLESIGEGDYYGFELDGNHLYCLGDMTVTHNTSMFNAIIFSLYGKGIDKLKTDEYINIKNEKGLEVTITFDKGGDEISITRKRKPNSLSISVNGTDLTLDSMKNTDEYIENLVGMSYDVFMATFFMAPHKTSFMAMSGPEQRSLIEEILSLDVLQLRAESLKAMKKDLEVDLKVLEKERELLTSEETRISTRIGELESKSELFVSENAVKVETKISQLQGIPDETECTTLRDDLKRLEDLNYELTKCSKEALIHEKDFRDSNARLVEIDREIASIEKTVTEIAQLRADIDEFDARKEAKKEEVLAKIEHYKAIDYYELVQDELKRLEKLKGERDTLVRVNNASLSELETIKSWIPKLEAKLDALKDGEPCPTCGLVGGNLDVHRKEINDEIDERVTNAEEVFETIQKQEMVIAEKSVEIEALSEKYMGEDPVGSIRELERLLDQLDAIEAESVDFMVKLLEGKGNLEDIQQTLVDLGKERELTEDSVSKLKEVGVFTRSKHDDLKAFLVTWEENLDRFGVSVRSENDIERFLLERERIIKEVDELRKAENPYLDEIVLLKKAIPDVKKVQSTIADTEKVIKHTAYLVKLLTDNKSFIRKNIVDRYIPFVNKRIVEYTRELGLPHICNINADMSVDIEYMTKNVSYYNMSQGERLRLNLATTFAFRDLMQMLGKTTNIMMVDEVLDSAFDSSGMYAAFRFMKSRASNIFIISHRDELTSAVDETITIIKRNGFSMV